MKWITRSNAADAQWKRDRDAVTYLVLKKDFYSLILAHEEILRPTFFTFPSGILKKLRYIDDNIFP